VTRIRLLGLVIVTLGATLLAVGNVAARQAAAPTIETIAGSGVEGRTGDGGPALQAEIGHPRGIALAPGGGYVFAEPFNDTLRRVWPDGTITTIAGTGLGGYSGDGGPATLAELDQPHGIAFTPSGGLLVADALNHRVRLIAPDGTISTVAGTGVAGFSGDGGPATQAEIDSPRGIAALPDGGFLIPDTDNQRIRRVWPDGRITTVAGDGTRGFAGDGGPATAAELASPFGVSPLPDGGFLIADAGNDRIRLVAPDGTISTVAGDGTRGYSGDGDVATSASLAGPHAVAAIPGGGFLIADTLDDRIRLVDADGTITTVAGTGVEGFSGDGGPASGAELDLPKALAVLPDLSGFLVGDSQNNRIRQVSLDLRPPLTLRLGPSRLVIRTGRTALLRYTVSLDAAVSLEVRRGGRLVVTARARVTAGDHALSFGRRLRPGMLAVILNATAADGRSARAKATLVVERRS
jgi:hypothetical protein